MVIQIYPNKLHFQKIMWKIKSNKNFRKNEVLKQPLKCWNFLKSLFNFSFLKLNKNQKIDFDKLILLNSTIERYKIYAIKLSKFELN